MAAKKVTIEGEVITRAPDGGKGFVLDFYKEDFVIEGVESKMHALSVIKKGLLGDRLKKKFKGYKRFRTHEVVAYENTEEKSDTEKLDKLLIKAQKAGCTPENLDNYSSNESKEKALEKSLENKAKRDKQSKGKKSNETLVDIED